MADMRFRPALTEGRSVNLEIGRESLRCRLVGFNGPDVLLMPSEAVSGRLRDLLGVQLAGFILFHDDAGNLHAQRGTILAASTPNSLGFRVTDGFRTGQRRAHSRAPLELEVTVGEWSTTTLDVSAGGLRVAGEGNPGLAPVVQLAVDLGDEQGKVEATASLVRVTPEAVSFRFESVQPADRMRIARLVLAWHFQQAAAAV
jgi:hypothetical protein